MVVKLNAKEEALLLLEKIKMLTPTPEPSMYKDGFQAWDDHYTESRKNREIFLDEYAWAIPSEDAINKIASFLGEDVCLEIGAGSGLWAYLLQSLCNANVIATDTKQHGTYKNTWEDYTEVIKLGARAAVRRYKQANALMFIWPYMEDVACTRALSVFNGNKIIYIGESEDGCTGTKKFFKILKSKYWKEVDEFAIPQWSGLHDYGILYERVNASV